MSASVAASRGVLAEAAPSETGLSMERGWWS